MSEPGFRQELKSVTSLNLYSSMAFWIFDPEYAAVFFHNISNKKVSEIKKDYAIDDINQHFVKSAHRIETAEEMHRYSDETKITLKTIFDRGDLSFAPDPNIISYKHSTSGLDLNLAVINQMLVRGKAQYFLT